MADGILSITPELAREKAQIMRKCSANLEALLNDVSRRMQDINDESTGTYHGAKRPSDLRAELDNFRGTFNKFSEQVLVFAGNVETIATRSENQ